MNPLLHLIELALEAGTGSGDEVSAGFSTGDPPEFEEIFESATQTIEDDPRNVQAYFARAVVSQSKRWYPQALADFVEVVKIEPKHARAWLLMSEVLAI